MLTKNLLITFLFFTLLSCGHPAEIQLQEKFQANKTDFIELVQMLEQDKDIVTLTKNNIFYEEGNSQKISAERLSEYRKLLDKLELKSGIHRGGPVISIPISVKGFPFESSSMGYAYSPSELSPIVSSLDQIIQNDPGDTSLKFEELSTPNWYLSYESW